MNFSRRSVLHAGAAALAAEAFGATIARALDIPAQTRTGTIHDVEHVIVLMQENRSFDHYFGALRGVRGFGDPRPLILPNGDPVWKQPDGHGGSVSPFRLDVRTTNAEHIGSLDHSWKGSHARWKNHDAWIPAKSPMTMGHFTREDLPFYYALADAFTICDAYHCSIFGPTSPNRNFLFTGTSGLSAGYDGPLAVRNSLLELNSSADPTNDSGAFSGLDWKTYAERLQDAGVNWKVYQEYDNYGDNSLAYFAKFRGAGANTGLMTRGRGCAAGSNKDNARSSRGEHMIADFADDVRAGRLPQVSWIVAPQIMTEHPSGGPGYGQSFTARLLAALVAAPEVWSKSVLLLNYDENDGFFDHVPPYVPALGPAEGASTFEVHGELYHGEPVGLGPRVPMLIVSPWSKGGFVNSQVFDHTSVLQFIERRFGVSEPNISNWRRVVCGDLTSAFEFASPHPVIAALPDTSTYIAAADQTHDLPRPSPSNGSETAQEQGQRPARALPYDLHANASVDVARKSVALQLGNAGAQGVACNAYAAGGASGPWFFAVEAGKSLHHELMAGVDVYDVTLHGPNGFVRRASGGFNTGATHVSVSVAGSASRDALRITLQNLGTLPVRLTANAKAYSAQHETIALAPGESHELLWPVAASSQWYDVEITADGDARFARRFAGHLENGAASVSDPMIAAV